MAVADNLFASLSDRRRQDIRTILQEAGCLECPHLVVVYGRNCNSYSCRQRTGCEKLTKTIALWNLVMKELDGAR